VNDDECSNACQLPYCGDKIKQAGEECDEGFSSNVCNYQCKFARCGDGLVYTSRGEQCDDGNTTSNDGCSATCQKETRIAFVSSKVYNGNLGGLAGADAKCQALAQAVGLPGTYMAWLSSSTASPSTRFNHFGGSYVTVTGMEVAGSWTQLTGGYPLEAINVTELGGSAPTSANNQCGSKAVWSNTNSNGTPLFPFAQTSACGDWTNTTGSGAYWLLGPAYGWYQWCGFGSGGCAWTAALYCFQQ
jgi:cysteine-rich repeat protein